MRWFNGLTLKKDPDAIKKHRWQFEDWLNGDTISGHSVIADTGITVVDSSVDGTDVVVTLSGGTAGETYDVTVRVTTAGGETDDYTVRFRIKEK